MAAATNGDATNDNGAVLRINRATVSQVIIWITAALLTYSAINSRVAVLEAQLALFRSDMSDMRQDIKTLLRRP